MPAPHLGGTFSAAKTPVLKIKNSVKQITHNQFKKVYLLLA